MRQRQPRPRGGFCDNHRPASRALNGRPGVRPEIRAAVLQSAEILGYLPNPAARKLVLGKTSLLALVVDDRDLVVGTDFFSELLSSLVATVDEAGYLPVLLLPGSPEERRELIHIIRRERFEGVVVVGHRAKDNLIGLLEEHSVPTVCLGRPIDCPPTSYVDVDNVQGARQAVEHLLQTGRQRIGLLAGPQDTSWGLDRKVGYEQALSSLDAEPEPGWIQYCDFTDRGGYQGLTSLLARCPDLDAVFCTSEALLRGALQALDDNGRRVPEDVAIVTFDDGPAQEYGTPSISAVRQPLQALGREIGSSLLKRVTQGAPVHHLVLATTFHIRESSSNEAPT